MISLLKLPLLTLYLQLQLQSIPLPDKFFEGRQKDREAPLEDLSKILSSLKEKGKSSSSAKRLRFAILYWKWK